MRRLWPGWQSPSVRFQSTHPVRGATLIVCGTGNAQQFQSTHPSRGATREHLCNFCTIRISIHAPLTGCDLGPPRLHGCHGHFNPRTPHGVRPARVTGKSSPPYFNPRTPHGVRPFSTTVSSGRIDFNPRTPHGVRRKPPKKVYPKIHFNPRTPHGVRLLLYLFIIILLLFQSTHPSRGATSFYSAMGWRRSFQSTHPSRGATETKVLQILR